MNRKIQRSAFIWNKKAFVTLYSIAYIQKIGLSIIFVLFFGKEIIEINTSI